MPRLPRYVLPGHPQHVIQRGNNRSPIFVADEDYACFKHHLQEACAVHGCRVHALHIPAQGEQPFRLNVNTDSGRT